MLNQHYAAPSLALVTENGDAVAVMRKTTARIRKWLRQRLCFAVNGGHELYRAHTDVKLYQRCLMCAYETNGWTIDRPDRRLRLVRSPASTVAR